MTYRLLTPSGWLWRLTQATRHWSDTRQTSPIPTQPPRTHHSHRTAQPILAQQSPSTQYAAKCCLLGCHRLAGMHAGKCNRQCRCLPSATIASHRPSHTVPLQRSLCLFDGQVSHLQKTFSGSTQTLKKTTTAHCSVPMLKRSSDEAGPLIDGACYVLC